MAIEGTDETGAALDRFVRTGQGDPAALLAASQSFLGMREALAVVRICAPGPCSIPTIRSGQSAVSCRLEHLGDEFRR